MVVAGEPSGDMHAGCLVENLKKDLLDTHIYGMGGIEMKKAGVDILVDSSKLSVVGIFEILKHYPAIKKAFTKLKKSIEANPPDLLILTPIPQPMSILETIYADFDISFLHSGWYEKHFD